MCSRVLFFSSFFNCKPVVVNHETFSHDANEPFFVHAAVSVSDIHIIVLSVSFVFVLFFYSLFLLVCWGGGGDKLNENKPTKSVCVIDLIASARSFYYLL